MKDVSITEHTLYIKYCKNYIKNKNEFEKLTSPLPCRIFKKIILLWFKIAKK